MDSESLVEDIIRVYESHPFLGTLLALVLITNSLKAIVESFGLDSFKKTNEEDLDFYKKLLTSLVNKETTQEDLKVLINRIEELEQKT